jgi:hypothetical protein
MSDYGIFYMEGSPKEGQTLEIGRAHVWTPVTLDP